MVQPGNRMVQASDIHVGDVIDNLETAAVAVVADEVNTVVAFEHGFLMFPSERWLWVTRSPDSSWV